MCFCGPYHAALRPFSKEVLEYISISASDLRSHRKREREYRRILRREQMGQVQNAFLSARCTETSRRERIFFREQIREIRTARSTSSRTYMQTSKCSKLTAATKACKLVYGLGENEMSCICWLRHLNRYMTGDQFFFLYSK